MRGPCAGAGPAWDADVGATGGEVGERVPTYEELCRAHVDAFISAAAAADVQSDLAAR